MANPTYRISVHARPAGRSSLPPLSPMSPDVRAFQGVPAEMPAFPISFETALNRWEELPGGTTEPDGSIFWRSATEETEAWQMEGVLYDRDGQLQYLQLTSDAGWGPLRRALATLGWPQTPLLFQLLQEGVFLDEANFRSWLETRGSRAAE